MTFYRLTPYHGGLQYSYRPIMMKTLEIYCFDRYRVELVQIIEFLLQNQYDADFYWRNNKTGILVLIYYEKS